MSGLTKWTWARSHRIGLISGAPLCRYGIQYNVTLHSMLVPRNYLILFRCEGLASASDSRCCPVREDEVAFCVFQLTLSEQSSDVRPIWCSAGVTNVNEPRPFLPSSRVRANPARKKRPDPLWPFWLATWNRLAPSAQFQVIRNFYPTGVSDTFRWKLRAAAGRAARKRADPAAGAQRELLPFAAGLPGSEIMMVQCSSWSQQQNSSARPLANSNSQPGRRLAAGAARVGRSI